ncbi:MAG: hypothetical protein HOO86_15265 [Bacteroidales bacterium]|nr:hypothetical protein [Bacteroidales bacterium]
MPLREPQWPGFDVLITATSSASVARSSSASVAKSSRTSVARSSSASLPGHSMPQWSYFRMLDEIDVVTYYSILSIA